MNEQQERGDEQNESAINDAEDDLVIDAADMVKRIDDLEARVARLEQRGD